MLAEQPCKGVYEKAFSAIEEVADSSLPGKSRAKSMMAFATGKGSTDVTRSSCAALAFSSGVLVLHSRQPKAAVGPVQVAFPRGVKCRMFCLKQSLRHGMRAP